MSLFTQRMFTMWISSPSGVLLNIGRERYISNITERIDTWSGYEPKRAGGSHFPATKHERVLELNSRPPEINPTSGQRII